jgi:hypothetical protein
MIGASNTRQAIGSLSELTEYTGHHWWLEVLVDGSWGRLLKQLHSYLRPMRRAIGTVYVNLGC